MAEVGVVRCSVGETSQDMVDPGRAQRATANPDLDSSPQGHPQRILDPSGKSSYDDLAGCHTWRGHPASMQLCVHLPLRGPPRPGKRNRDERKRKYCPNSTKSMGN
ncbi:hypothetical protein JEQ12_001901 [Ovis aries]|uniref:Uncharacterized protein n=1 Tax=Ovis aries TaxID=9940 RepID=A0A836AI00_SHEEP|nr:hypothetical protein JEQ12_001901 [Ovis aries]